MNTHLREEQFWLLTGGVLMLAFVAFSFAMYFTRSFMIPFVFSILLCSMVSPVDNLIVVRWKMPRWLGFIGSLAVILLLFFMFFFVTKFAISSIRNAINEVSLNESTTSTTESFTKSLDSALQKMGIDEKLIDAKRIITPIREEIPTLLSEGLKTCQKFVSSSTLVLLFCIFILMGRDPHVRVQNEIYNEIERSIQKYLNIKFFISLATGVCVYATFLFLDVRMAFLFGLIAFVLNFIPSIGSIIATILPIPIIMLTENEMSHGGLLLAFLIPCLIQNFFGNLLEPKLQGKGLKLHPVTILLALGFCGVVWGPVGMLLAAPLTAALRIVLLEFKMTNWTAELMGGKLPSRNIPLSDSDGEWEFTENGGNSEYAGNISEGTELSPSASAQNSKQTVALVSVQNSVQNPAQDSVPPTARTSGTAGSSAIPGNGKPTEKSAEKPVQKQKQNRKNSRRK